MHIYAPTRRREERKTNGTDWFPAVARATLTRWQLQKRAPGLPWDAGNTRTPVNNPIKMDRKPPVPYAVAAAIVVIIALYLRRDYYIAVAIVRLYRSDVFRAQSSVFKPRLFIDIPCLATRNCINRSRFTARRIQQSEIFDNSKLFFRHEIFSHLYRPI